MGSVMRVSTLLAIGAGTGALLARVAPFPGLVPRITEIGRDPGTAVAVRGVDSVVGTVAAAGSWVALGWLVLAVATVVAHRLPGRAGRCADVVAALLVPLAARRVLAAALGLALAGAAGATAVGAAPGPAGSPSVASVDLDRTTTAPEAGPAPAMSPTGAVPAGSGPGVADDRAPAGSRAEADDRCAPGGGTVAGSEVVVVRPGDSLWTIAARHLGPEADDRRVAQEWPRWWGANRAEIGSEPALISPGGRLVPPAPADPCSAGVRP